MVRLIPPDPGYLRATFTIEHVELLGMYDNRGQQWAHRAVVLLLALVALAAWLARPRTYVGVPAGVQQLAERYAGFALLILYAILLVLEGRPRVGDATIFHGRYALFPALSLRTQVLLSLSGMVCLYLWARWPVYGRAAERVGAAAVALLAVTLITLGVLRDPSFQGFTPGLVSGVEWHYSGAVSSADRLAVGERLGDVPIHSSLLASVLLGAWQRAHGVLDFGGHIRLLALLQAAMVVLAAAAYAAWYRGRMGAWTLAFALALPWIQPLQAAVLYPNQSAWRFLGLCAGLTVLALAHAGRLMPLAGLLGAVGGFALLWNAETGVVLNGAYVVFLYLRGARSKAALAYLAGLAGVLLAFCVVARAGLSYWPDLAAIARAFPLIGNFSRGYGGLRFSGVDALALLVFAHSLYLVACGVLDWAHGERFSARKSARVALAALLVAWAAYYFKAPHPWNLWSSLLIYGFLLGDLLPAPGAKPLRMLATARAVIVGALIIPAIVASNAMAFISATRTLRQPPCAEGGVVSSVCLPDDLAGPMRAKADALKQAAGQQRILYFTADSYLIPLLSGVSHPLRYRDAFSDVVFASDFDALVEEVRAVKPACILYDDPASTLSGYDGHRAFYRRLRESLGENYSHVTSLRGWNSYCMQSAR